MKKILFPTEFSDHSSEVFKYAAELAYNFKARLTVMYAYQIEEEEMDSEVDTMHEDSTDRMIDFVMEHLPKKYKSNIKVDYLAKEGFSAEAILEAALDEDIDLIVMGMTGQTNALDTFFGSTSLNVLSKAECPVMVVPATAKFSEIKNIVCTTNFEFRDLEAINYLQKWSKALNAPLHCLHIIEQEDNEMHALKNKNILKETYKRRKNILFDMVFGDFKEGITTFAKKKDADILTMMSHKRNFVSRLVEQSAIKGVAQKIDIPLLVIKDNAYELDNNADEWVKMLQSIG